MNKRRRYKAKARRKHWKLIQRLARLKRAVDVDLLAQFTITMDWTDMSHTIRL